MLLHDFLRRKAAILAKAEAEVENLLTDIGDPKTRAAVDDWEPGDPITDEYPQVDQNTGKPDVEKFWEKAHTDPDSARKEAEGHTGEVLKTNLAETGGQAASQALEGAVPIKPGSESAETIGQSQEAASAQLNHQPEGQPQQEPASGNAPA
jgi:hypothetical protein